MTLHAWIALATLVFATTMFITRWVPLAMTALAVPVILCATEVLPKEDALMGFGNHAVLAIGAVMILGGALRESGVATLMARGIQRVGGKSELGLMLLFMSSTAFLAVFMNNTAVVAILLPVAAALSRRSGVAASRLFMPMAFAAVLGGTISLIGTAPNFLAADFYNATPAGKKDPIGIFDYALVGIPITLAGIVFMALVGRRLLPAGTSRGTETRGARDAQDAAQAYDLPSKLFEMRLVKGSGIVGKTLRQANLRARFGLGVVAIQRPNPMGQKWYQPEADLVFEPEDHVFLVGDEESAWELSETEMLQFGLADANTIERLLERGTSIAEVTLSPHSRLIGNTFRNLDFQKRYELSVIGFWRRNAAVTEDPGNLKLELGDAFLVAGRPRSVVALGSNPNFVVLTDPSHREDVGRAPLAIAILLLALVPPVFFNFPLAVSALGAACLMVLTGCLAKRHVPQTIDWSVLALIAGTLPLGKALQTHHISDHVATAFSSIAATGGSVAVYALLFLLSATFSVLTSNAAAAVIVAPVAAATALAANLDPRGALLAMAYGCSCNFLLPFAQCNLLVMTPGGYSTRDYIRVGAPMSVVMAITTIAMLAIFF